MNFGLNNTTGVSTRKPSLKPYEIHDVVFDGVTADEFQGKKDTSKTYHVMKVSFSNDEGSYTETIFYPETEKDTERMSFDNTDRDGKPYKSYMPSTYDRAMATVAQVAATINPEGWKKFQAAANKGMFKSFDDVVKALIQITKEFNGKFKTKLKLIGRNNQGNIVAALPNFVKINREGEWYIADNFIGSALGFTPAEEAKRRQFLNATPDTMEDSDNDIDVSNNEEDTFDLDSLEV